MSILEKITIIVAFYKNQGRCGKKSTVRNPRSGLPWKVYNPRTTMKKFITHGLLWKYKNQQITMKSQWTVKYDKKSKVNRFLDASRGLPRKVNDPRITMRLQSFPPCLLLFCDVISTQEKYGKDITSLTYEKGLIIHGLTWKVINLWLTMKSW